MIRDTLMRRGLNEEQLRRLIYPAGLDMGHVSDEEIALSILARIIAVRRGEQTLAVRVVAPATATAAEPTTAIDPVCGMAVAAVTQTPHVDHEGRRVYFCCDGCRSTWTRSHVPQ